MMKKGTWLAAAAVAGLLAVATAAGATGLTEKVTGLLKRNVEVVVDGRTTSLQPVYIGGKAYLPARETADLLGYSLRWSKERIELEAKEEKPAEMKVTGVVTEASKEEDRYKLEIFGEGPYDRIVLYADSETVISGTDKKIYTLADLKAGQRVTAEYGAYVALSSPPQAHAVSIHVHEEGTVTEGSVYSIEPSKEGWRIQLSEGKPGEEKPVLILRAKPDTLLVTRSGSPADWTQLGPGVRVKAYVPLEWLQSMPPQTFPRLIVILDEELDIDMASSD